MKLIFLDIDGVLNNRESIGNNVHLLPEKSLMIREICERTGADIIVSSAWRFSTGYEFALWRSGIPRDKILGCTLKSMDGKRGDEIKESLEDMALEQCIESYIIIDDEISDMLDGQKSHIIHTSINTGITQEHMEKAISILGEKHESSK